MKGIRFYRSSVTFESTPDWRCFHHDEIESGTSDFEYIFRCIYRNLDRAFILTDQFPFPDSERDYDESTTFSEELVWSEESHYCARVSLLYKFGRFMPEFEGGIILVLDSAPEVMTWNEFCVFEDRNIGSVEVVLHNWDGIYWEIFMKREQLLDALIRQHQNDKNLELYHVNYRTDYPEPSGQKNSLKRI